MLVSQEEGSNNPNEVIQERPITSQEIEPSGGTQESEPTIKEGQASGQPPDKDGSPNSR